MTAAGGGAAIPLRPRLLGRLVGAAVEGASGAPVTVKMRMGVTDDLLTFMEVSCAGLPICTFRATSPGSCLSLLSALDRLGGWHRLRARLPSSSTRAQQTWCDAIRCIARHTQASTLPSNLNSAQLANHS